ncbi:Cytochrome P450 [Mycena sanguinolenta]|uniref:Cytochrome P450 n=1 Tax=Mycena sanguinolenta TaxID=230812 RepID=A0A8H6ZB93_9AGAR|nr:Cytochrome P450 [Mycena sanguinolenta]
MEHTLRYTAPVVAVVLILYLRLRHRSAIQGLAGPPSPSWIFGHMRQLLLSPRYGAHEFNWLNLYGPVYALKGCFGQDRLMVADPHAMQYILNSPNFRRSPTTDSSLNILFGEKGLLLLRGSEYRRIRSALNIGFTAAAVRSYHAVFKTVAEQICEQLENFPSTATDVCSVLSAATLEATCQAILGRSTRDLGEKFAANNIEIVKLTASQSETHVLADAIGSHLPTWLWRAAIYLPTKAFAVAREGRFLGNQVGGRIVREKREAIAQGLETGSDLFSFLVNPNHSNTLAEQDLVPQTAVVLIAGQETTTNTISFALLELARHPDFQDRLRAEIYSTLGGSNASLAYETMPLLNAFVKEILRLYPAVPLADRIVMEDTVIPLSESIISAKGERISQIPVRKGEIVTIAIAAYQRLPSRWGKDPHTFNPSRWLDGETYQGEAVGPYANLLSFFGGPHICLGWRFAILEMQVIICELVAKFSFAEADNEPAHPRLMLTLQPFAATGERALRLRVTRLL